MSERSAYRLLGFALVGLSLMSASCAGVKCSVKADQVACPVSYTSYVYDTNGAVIRAAPQHVVKHFRIKKTFWAMLWRSCALTTPEWDASQALSAEVSAARGNAVVNLTVVSYGDWWWMASSLLPILPDYHTIILDGDVASLPKAAAR